MKDWNCMIFKIQTLSFLKRGPEAKFSFVEKVLRKGGSVAKRGTTGVSNNAEFQLEF